MTRSACVWLVCACATSASAQTPAAAPPAIATASAPVPQVAAPSRSYRAPKPPPQTLHLNVSLFGGNAEDVNAAASGTDQRIGAHVDADAGMVYERRAGHATFTGRASSVFRQSAQTGLTPMWQQGGVDFSFADARQQFHAGQGISYSPYYEFGGLPQPVASPLDVAAASHGDFANRDLAAMTSTTDVSWSHSLSRRVALSATYGLRRTTFGRSDLDMLSQSAGARLTRRFTRYVSLRAGYTYRLADPAFARTLAPPRNHELDLGVDYSRPVSVSKRTTLSFATGSALTPQEQLMVFNLTGSAALTRQIGRTWSARVGVNRGVQLLEGFMEPVLTNALNATVGGTVHRRATLSSSVAFSNGVVGLDPSRGNHYTNFTGGAGLSLAIGRHAAIEAQYFFAGYRFEGDLAFAPGLPNGRQQRHGVRVGYTWHNFLLNH